MDSPLRSPLHHPNHTDTFPLPLPAPPQAAKSPSPPHSLASKSPSPPRTVAAKYPSSPPPSTTAMKSPSPSPSPSPPRPVAMVNRANREETKAVGAAEDGGAGERDRGSRVVSGIVRRSRREAAVGRAAVGVRIAAAVLSLISFSVMAADKTKGWAGDSFDRYKEYRYCISVNVIAFVYSSFQTYAHVHHMLKGKHLIHAPIRYYFDLSMDQILAYLLLSASSSAVARNDDWVSNWGSDPFTVMINGSISMSFLAFIAFAISSLISAYNFFGRSAQ